MAIHLGRPLPDASRDRPGRRRENSARRSPARKPETSACRPYLVLLPVGFTVPPPLPATRCALTAPFQPCRQPAIGRGRRSALCGTFPGVAPAGRYPAPCFRGARTFLPRRRQAPAGESGHPAVWLPHGRNRAAVCKRPLRRSARKAAHARRRRMTCPGRFGGRTFSRNILLPHPGRPCKMMRRWGRVAPVSAR